MTTLSELRHKYSWGQIPQWELDKLEQQNKPVEAEAPKPRRGRPPKQQVDNGDSTADSDPST